MTLRVKRELESPNLSHLYAKSSASIDGASVVDRLQQIAVTSKNLTQSDNFVGAVMDQEAIDFATILPDFLKGLFVKGESVHGGEGNKFEDIPPSFAIYDVSYWTNEFMYLTPPQMFQGFVPQVVSSSLQSHNLPDIPLIMFVPSNAVSVYRSVSAHNIAT